ncbi:MAG: LytTR family DNA-binding domain-containing protein [Streptococcaceae bacterium]|jgi:DNA-binding LytR/AlgR family response regulator|nr:LytTR family DNA-binding domain-containing protein [Streptococcaceae bacterium]
MIKVAICDDSVQLASKVEEIVLQYQSLPFDTEVFTNPLELLTYMKEHHVEVFILDIEMPEMSGIELAMEIRKINQQALIIFQTSHTEFMREAFRVHTFDYLNKPVTKEKMFDILERVEKFLDMDVFTFSFNKKNYSIRYSTIIYFEKQLARIFIHTIDEEEEELVTRLYMSELMEKLNSSFVQISRSHVVNISFIQEIGKGQVVLKSGAVLPMGRTFEAQAREKILARLVGDL